MKTLPPVARVLGATLYPHNQPERGHVEIQYSAHNNELCSVDIPILDALYLLNILDAMAKDNGLDELRSKRPLH